MIEQDNEDRYRRHVRTAAHHAELLSLDDKHKLGLEFIAQGLQLVFVGFHYDVMRWCAPFLVEITAESLKQGLGLKDGTNV
ncbi:MULTISPECIES: hypothetical protein [unclassified Bradyrhizobium]|uniref:hypothetical protein n=1 Tax=Bradyrhizobium sp. USDA 4541 TaxID=2817704 RepID=UPI0020A4CF38|nr:hypothetical protein [Bradyrhizobium sp. USDA 4541]MCP1852106.1 hypothetical protein [Bradyrhizobium sp. USDA 4541]